MPTLPDEILDVLVEAQPIAFAPQPHVGGVEAPLALVRGAHGEEVPAQALGQAAGLGSLRPAGHRTGRPQREAVVRDVDEARVAAVGESPAALLVPPGVCLVPVIGGDGHGQETQGDQRERQAGV